MRVVKLPWQMTRGEFLDYQAKYLMERSAEAPPTAVEKVATLSEAQKILERDPDSLRFQLDINRKEQIAQALAEGKPVPSLVLADYPDLAKA